MALDPRRSRRSTAGKRQQRLYISSLSATWRRAYLDVGHCRLQKCTKIMQNASPADISQLQQLNTTFVAMAISASSAYGASKEVQLVDYAHVVTERGLNANDIYNGNSALTLAAYHGYVRLVEYLVDLGSSLDSRGSYGNVVEASLRNGQHEALELLLEKRPDDAAVLFCDDKFSMALRRAICKMNVAGVRLLVNSGRVKPTLNDWDLTMMRKKGHVHRCLVPVLGQLYPHLPNVVSWSKQIHWSFPTNDRQALNLLWYTVGNRGRLFPGEIWLAIFSFIGRGWFASEPVVSYRALSILR